MNIVKKIIIGVLMFLSIVSGIYTFNQNSKGFYNDYVKESYDMVTSTEYDLAFDTIPSIVVKNSNLTLNVGDSKKTREDVTSKINDLNGYVTYVYNYANEQYCRYDMTVKIPQDKYDEFLAYINGLGDVTNFSENQMDMTKEYKDVEKRIQLYETKLTKLYELEEKCDDIGNLLTITNEIENTIYQLEQLHKNEDNLLEQSDYCSISLLINEEKDEQIIKYDYLAIIKDSIVDSINAFVTTVIYGVRIVILVAPFALAGFAVYLVVKKIKKNKK